MSTKKHDVFPWVIAVGTGFVVYMTYWTGKFGGRAEAYNECAKIIKDAAGELGKAIPNETEV